MLPRWCGGVLVGRRGRRGGAESGGDSLLTISYSGIPWGVQCTPRDTRGDTAGGDPVRQHIFSFLFSVQAIHEELGEAACCIYIHLFLFVFRIHCLCVFCVGPLCGPPLRWWVLCGVLPSVWVPYGWAPPPVVSSYTCDIYSRDVSCSRSRIFICSFLFLCRLYTRSSGRLRGPKKRCVGKDTFTWSALGESTLRVHVKISTGHTHAHTDREQHPRHRHTRTRQEQHPKPPNEHLPQTLNNARRWRDDVLDRYSRIPRTQPRG